ncbi:hypothetical protein [Planomonospora parontospora]|uniref:hypothetical protein n=1 Tax=Planomonospora parontospora TaxID=58119 RepID=UPI00166FB920|nr:hypothetical protein [Planomonospora parontospora]GGL55235.1 hypothetical protein GCM10014719_65640 [Planomonospora parontospora subsp. antibiotica]GII19790.1 hypothetical protein Ppa05_65160 [Planomonospora parontospora subsp. antibiotica]
MKRWVVLATAVLAAVLPVAAPAAAHTATPDPVHALKRQFRPERGVHIAEVTRFVFENKQSMRFRVHGRAQLGSSRGVVASDATMQLVIDPPLRKLLESKDGDELRGIGLEDPQETIVVGGYRYVSHTLYATSLPAGKTWVRSPYLGEKNTASFQTIDVFEPAVVKAMLAGVKAKPVSGGFFYQGAVSYRQLAKASKHPSDAVLRETLFGGDDEKITWRLWTDAAGLPTRLMTAQITPWDSSTTVTQRIDTRYSGWGSHVVVQAPPTGEVIDENDLPADRLFEVPEPKELINAAAR